MAVITLDWRERNSASILRTFRSILQASQQTRRGVDQLARSIDLLNRGGVQVNTGDSARRIASLSQRAQQLRQELRSINQQPLQVQVQQSGFREFSQSISGTNQELTAVQQRLLAYQQANTQLANSIGVPISSIRQLNVELGTLRSSAGNIISRYGELRTAGESSVGTFRQLNTEFGLNRQQFDALQRTIGLSTQSLTALTLAAGTAATAIGRIFQGGATNFLALERSLQGAAVRAGESREGFSGVADEVERLGATTAFTAPQIAAVTDQLSRIGFTASEQGQALDGLVRTALSSGESISTVTQVVASALRQFNLSTADTAQVGDLLSTAANRSNVSVSSLGESLRFVAPQARQLGISLDDTVLSLSLLGDNALRGGIGGRNLARALEVLNLASAASNSELSELAGNNSRAVAALERLGTATRDASGNFLPLFDVLGQIQAELATLENQADRDILLSALGGGAQGGRALNTLITTIEDTPEAVAELRSELNNASAVASRAAEELQRGLPGAVTQIQSAFEGLQIRFFEEFADEAELIVRTATEVVRAFLDLPQPIQSALIATTALTGTLAAAIAIIAGYQLAVQTLGAANISLSVSTVRAQAAQAGQTAVSVANTAAARSNAIAQINVATAINGIAAASGRAVAGLGAQTAALRANAATAASGFATTLRGLQLNAQGLANLRLAVIGNPFFQAGVYAGVAAAVISVADTFQRVTAGAEETRDRIDDIQEALGGVARAQQEVADSADDAAAAVQAELAQNAELAADNLGRLQQVFDALRAPISSVQESVESLVSSFIDLLPLPDSLRNRIQSLIDIFPQVATASEASANRQAVAFGELISQTDQLLNSVSQSLTQGADASVIEAQLSALQQNIAALEAERPVTEQAIAVRNQYLETLRATEAQLRSGSQSQSDNADAVVQATNEQAQAFENLFNSVRNSLAATDSDELAARAQLEQEKAELIRNGGTLEAIEDVNQRIFDSEQEFNTSRIQQLEIARERLTELSGLDPEAAQENAEEIQDINDQINRLQIEGAQAVTNQLGQEEEQRLETIRRSFDEQAALIESNNQERIRRRLRLQQDLAASGAGDQDAQAIVRVATVQDEGINLRELIALERERVAAFNDGTDEKAQAVARLDQLETQAEQNRLDAIEARRAQELQAIESRQAADIQALNNQAAIQQQFFTDQQRSIEQSGNVLSRATQEIERQNSALDRQRALLQARNNLQGALDTTEVTQLERALEVRQRLNSEEELSATEQRALQRELAALTGSRNASEQRIQRELLQAERQRSENQLESLRQSQTLEQRSLELDIQKNAIASRRQAIESEIAVIQAQVAQASLQTEQQRLAIQQRALRAQLSGVSDPARRAELEGQIQANQIEQTGIAGRLAASEQELGLRRQALELRLQDQATLTAEADQQRQLLGLQQAQTTLEITRREAADARATATQIAADGSSRLVNTANQNAVSLERQAAAAERLATALQQASTVSLSSGGTSIPGFREGTGPAGAPGGIAVVGESGPEIVSLPQGTQVFSNTASRQMARQALQTNPEISQQLRINPAVSQAMIPSISALPSMTPLVQQQLFDQSKQPDLSGIQSSIDTMIQKLEVQNNKPIQAGGNTYNITSERSPEATAQKIMLDNLKAIARF